MKFNIQLVKEVPSFGSNKYGEIYDFIANEMQVGQVIEISDLNELELNAMQSSITSKHRRYIDGYSVRTNRRLKEDGLYSLFITKIEK